VSAGNCALLFLWHDPLILGDVKKGVLVELLSQGVALPGSYLL